METRLYKITYSFMGIKRSYNIVADSLAEAFEAGNMEVVGCVDDSYKKEAAAGKYLLEITVLDVINASKNSTVKRKNIYCKYWKLRY